MKHLAFTMLYLFWTFPALAADIEVYFSPNGGCERAIVSEIAAAKETIHVQAYSFTSEPIATALAAAKKRGVNVQVILDKGQPTAHGSQIPAMLAAGVPTKIDRKHAIAHNKIIVVDFCVVLTGSFNFSAGAEHNNAENLLVIRSEALATGYIDNWSKHAEHSEIFKPGEKE